MEFVQGHCGVDHCRGGARRAGRKVSVVFGRANTRPLLKAAAGTHRRDIPVSCPARHNACAVWLLTGSSFRYITGFNLVAQRFEGRIVALMAADVLLGDEMRWSWIHQHGTAAFLESSTPRMFVLSRSELDESVDSCCALNLGWVCHDMFMFRSPIHPNVRLDLFNYQQNIWQGENYAVGLLRAGGYELYNPCFHLPLFHNHNSGQRPNQNENRCASFAQLNCVKCSLSSHS